MFCRQCGAQIPEGAKFCRKCGASIPDRNEQQPTTGVFSENLTQIFPENQNEGKKKSKKVLWIVGAVMAVVVVAVIVTFYWARESYIGRVKEYIPYNDIPFEDMEDMPYTCGEVLNQYIISAKWKVRAEEDVHYVDVEGKVNGIEDVRMKVTFEVRPDSDDPDLIWMVPGMVTVYDKEERGTIKDSEVLYTLFRMYDEGEKDLSGLAEDAASLILNWKEEINELYIKIVEECTPNEDMSYTYGEVLNQYISSAEWKVREEDDGVYYVDVEGQVNGIKDSKMAITFKVRPNLHNSEMRWVILQSATIYDKEERETIKGQDLEQFLNTLFRLYDEGEKDLSSLAENLVLEDETGATETLEDSGICFYHIPVSEWIAADKEEVLQWLGDGCTIDEYEDWGCISYAETDIYLRGDGTISSISSYELEELSVDGQAFHADSDEDIEDAIIELFGSDYEEEDYWLTGGYMSTVYRYPQYTLSFDFSRNDARWSVVISEPSEEEGIIFGYEEEDAPSSVYIQEPIENYLRLSGSYSASVGQSSLSIGIYTSQEEGEIEIGTVVIYAEDGDYFVGTLIPTAAGVYEVVTDTGEEFFLIEVDSDDAVTLDMYVDGQYLEEYWMTEHYQP